LKGENGVPDCLKALNTLTETLFILVRAMAPFTPFLSDAIYQRLRPLYTEETLNKYGKDHRCVHFLSYPTVNEELFDEKIETAVGRMQKIIDLGRNIREKKMISLKTPLKELVILNSDPDYINDVTSLKKYIIEELNVREVVITSDEEKYGVEYRAVADWPVLGKKLKKDAKIVKDGLPKLTSDDVKDFLKSGKVTVSGIDLTTEDLNVLRGLPDSKTASGQESRAEGDVLIILDINLYPELETEGIAREIVNRIQRLRKKCGLDQTEEVQVQYAVKKDDCDIEKVIKDHADFLLKSTKVPMEHIAESEKTILGEEEATINDTVLSLRLLKL
jgi:isoleucyl-tRNA synthetase